MRRHVAQPGSAPSWGVGGRRFKSSRADQKYIKKPAFYGWFFYVSNYAWRNSGEMVVKHSLNCRAIIIFCSVDKESYSTQNFHLFEGNTFYRLAFIRNECLPH